MEIIRNKNLLLIIIVAVAAFFRLYLLNSIPPSPSLDEASLGYNAYSILKTGADEFGNKFPILLRAYDDWRPALYVYLIIPFVKLLGLNILAVRLPSVILSVLTVLTTYFLMKELLVSLKNQKEYEYLPLLTSFLLAISPWHIYISRLGHEVNAGLSFLIFGLYFFIKYINHKKLVNLIFSAILLGLSFDAYQSTKIVIPLIVIVLACIFLKSLVERKRDLLIAIIVGFLIIFPILIESFKPNALIRFQGTSVFNERNEMLSLDAKRSLVDINQGAMLGEIFHNRRFVDFPIIIHSYFSHINPVWLFLNQGSEDFKIPDFGLLYVIELPFLIMGIFYFLISSFPKKIKILIISWLLIAILPGALTSGYPHAMRIFNILPLPQLFVSLGVLGLIMKFKRHFYIMCVAICFFYIIFISWFFHSYFTHFPQLISNQFQYGIIQAFNDSGKISKNYDVIVVSNKNNLRASYMYYLFMSKTDPFVYQKQGGTVSGWFSQDHKIGKYVFTDPSSYIVPKKKKILYIINPYEVGGLRTVFTERFMNGEDAVWIAR